MPGSAQRSSRAFASLNLAQVAALAAGVYASIVVARTLGSDGRGVVALAAAGTLLAASMASGGVELALSRFAATLPLATAAAHTATWVAGIGVSAALAWGLFTAATADYWGVPASTALWLLALGCLAFVALNLLRGALVGQRRFGHVAAGRTAFAATLFAGTTFLWLADLLTARSAVLVTFLSAASQAAWYWGALGWPRSVVLDVGILRRYGTFALKAQPGVIFQAAFYRLDLLLVGLFLAVSDAGQYIVALSLAELCLVPVEMLALIVLGSAASAAHTPSTTGLVTRLAVIVGLLEATFLAVAGGPIIRYAFGFSFEDAYAPLVAMLPGIVAFAAWRVLMHDASGRDHPEFRSKSVMIGAALGLLLNLAAIPTLGLIGAGAVSSVSGFVVLLVGAGLYSRAFGTPISELLVPRPADITRLREFLRPSIRFVASSPRSGQTGDTVE